MRFCEENLVKKLFYKNSREFALELIKKYSTKKEKDDYYLLTVIGDYDNILPILNELVRADYKLVFSEFEDVGWSGYKYPYLLSVYKDEISLEKAYNVNKGQYISVEADDIYIITPSEYPTLRVNIIGDGMVYNVSISNAEEDKEKQCKCVGDRKCNNCKCESADNDTLSAEVPPFLHCLGSISIVCHC